MKKFLKIIGIILLVLIIIFIIHTVRNYIIIKRLQNNIAPYALIDNYHIKSIAKEGNNIIVDLNYYKKGNKQVVILKRNKNNEITKLTMYDDGDKIDVFTENNTEKTCRLDAPIEGMMPVVVFNYLNTDNDLQTILLSMIVKIRSVNIENKSCYYLKDIFNTNILYDASVNSDGESFEVYIEKDTGLGIRSLNGGMETTREYEFNNVDDSVFIEPDVSEYTIK